MTHSYHDGKRFERRYRYDDDYIAYLRRKNKIELDIMRTDVEYFNFEKKYSEYIVDCMIITDTPTDIPLDNPKVMDVARPQPVTIGNLCVKFALYLYYKEAVSE